MADSTLRRTSSLTSGRSFSTRETVLTLTLQSFAISLIVIRRVSFLPNLRDGNISGNVSKLRNYPINI